MLEYRLNIYTRHLNLVPKKYYILTSIASNQDNCQSQPVLFDYRRSDDLFIGIRHISLQKRDIWNARFSCH